MGNITYEIGDDEDELEQYLSDDSNSSLGFDAESGHDLRLALGNVLVQFVDQNLNEMPPVIRKKPDLKIFRVSYQFTK